MLKRFTKEERSWIMYDVANSAFVITVMTALFPLYFGIVTKDAGIAEAQSTAYLAYANSFYSLIIAFLSPVLGTIADYKGKKKKMFLGFFYLGIIGGLGLAIPGMDWQVLIIVFVIAMIGYSGSNVFYDAFLTDVTVEERMDEVSSYGFAYGYIMSLIPFVIGIIPFALSFLGVIDFDIKLAVSIAILINVAWWYFMTQPMVKNVKQKYFVEPEEKYIRQSFTRLFNTFKEIKKYKNLFLFLIAYFFYIDVVGTIISMAVKIAGDLGVGAPVQLGLVIYIQVIAFPCAIIFGKMAKKFGSKNMLLTGAFMYLLVVMSAMFITPGREWVIWILGTLVGMAQGGIQAISRSYYAKMIPNKENSNEFFGFFNIFGKFATILGPVVIGFIAQITGDTRTAILGLIPLLVIGIVLLLFVKEETPA
jgi:UMF1 family MFS transporter